jgi:hypothetical protein
VVRPVAVVVVAEAAVVTEQAPARAAEPEPAAEQARELMVVAQSNLALRSSDSRYHRNP